MENGLKTVYDVGKIMETIPHRYPFLLVDRIVEDDPGKRIVGLKNVTINEPFFEGHYPAEPIMPGLLQVEALGQVACLLLLGVADQTDQEKIPLLMGCDRIKFRRKVVPGDQLLLEVTLVKERRNIFVVHGVGTVDGQVSVEADLKAMITYRP